MKKFILTEEEKNRIKNIYESEGIILSEDTPVGYISKVARKLMGKSSDDIATALKGVESVAAKSIDDIVTNALKTKNVSEMESLSLRLMHFFNPSGSKEGVAAAEKASIAFLNGYAKSKGKANWQIIKDEIMDVKPQSAGAQQSASAAVRNYFTGQRISNRHYFFTDPRYANAIDWSKILNAKNMDEYNKVIALAIQTKDFSKISRGGFEQFGIKNFRDELMNNISRINDVDPTTGRWSVIFK